jgi:hypothetical protein
MKALEICIVISALIIIVVFAFISGVFVYTIYVNHLPLNATVCVGGERLDFICKDKGCQEKYYHWVKTNKSNNCTLDTLNSDNLTYLKMITNYTGVVHEYI